MFTHISRSLIRALLTAAILVTGSAGAVYAGGGGEGGGGERQGMPLTFKGGKAPKVRKAAPVKVRGGPVATRKSASPRKWSARDRNGRETHRISRSRVTGRYTVGERGRSIRNGRPTTTWSKSYSERQWRNMTTYNPRTDTTTVRIPRGRRTQTIVVAGNATPPR